MVEKGGEVMTAGGGGGGSGGDNRRRVGQATATSR